MPSRATLEQLLTFANRVREAGGGNPLDALMPAVPADASACLIAKNLNFNCTVTQYDVDGIGDGKQRWVMSLEDEATRDKIAEGLNLRKFNRPSWDGVSYGVVLPVRIGLVARAFDKWDEIGESREMSKWDFAVGVARRNKKRLPRIGEYLTKSQITHLQEFAPYIEEAETEATLIGQLNEHGQLVL